MTASQTLMKAFRKKIWAYYRKHKRDFAWRRTRDPYKILVSEIMLQQTQTKRVVDKYKTFIKKFPDFKLLARASLHDVLKQWQGLGYNRRAKYLWEIAQKVIKDYKGKLPSDTALLQKMPGIGKGTAGAIAAFAFNKPEVFIETNIRSVFIHYFFPKKKAVSDGKIFQLVAKTIDQYNPREWYYALMDYGAMLKTKVNNPNRKSAHYMRQSRFMGSDRQLRGAIIRVLTQQHAKISTQEIKKLIDFPSRRITIQLRRLMREGMVANEANSYRLA